MPARRLAASAAIAMLMAAGAVNAQQKAPAATAELKNPAGETIGQARFTEAPRGVLITLEAKGLAPGWHGMHLHEAGDCSKPDFTSAGGHVHADAAKVHGLLNPAGNEQGDLPNLFVDMHGAATGEFFTTLVSLKGSGGRPALLDKDGSAIVIHANPDDHTSQPIGGAGARVACGVVR
jgi:Cu-Zn family superoxide dismutase